MSVNHHNTLVVVHGNRATTTSLLVAEMFGKQHKNVLRAIENLIADLPESNGLNFEPVEYTDAKGEKRSAYEISRDAFSLLAMGFTGKAALEWKLKFLEAFNLMEAALNGQRRLPLYDAADVYHSTFAVARSLHKGTNHAALAANAAARDMTGIDLFELMQIDLNATGPEDAILLEAVSRMMAVASLVKGSFKEVVERLTLYISPDSSGLWLPSPRGLRTRLNQISPLLAERGIGFEFGGHSRRGRLMAIYRLNGPVLMAQAAEGCKPCILNKPDQSLSQERISPCQ